MRNHKCKCCGGRKWVRMIVCPDTFAWKYRGCPICSGGSANRPTITQFAEIHSDRMKYAAEALSDSFKGAAAALREFGRAIGKIGIDIK